MQAVAATCKAGSNAWPPGEHSSRRARSCAAPSCGATPLNDLYGTKNRMASRISQTTSQIVAKLFEKPAHGAVRSLYFQRNLIHIKALQLKFEYAPLQR